MSLSDVQHDQGIALFQPIADLVHGKERDTCNKESRPAPPELI